MYTRLDNRIKNKYCYKGRQSYHLAYYPEPFETLHRTDGPAAEYASGVKDYYIDGHYLDYLLYCKVIQEVKDMDPAMRLTDPRWWVREWK